VPKQKLRNLAKRYRPREKAAWQGVTALRDSELLALIIGSGQPQLNALELGKKVEPLLHSSLVIPDKASLQKIYGIGEAIALRILASLELGQRHSKQQKTVALNTPSKIYALAHDLQHKKQEHCLAFYLNGRQELLGKKTISIGGLNYNYLEPREIFAEGFVLRASSLILVHNHPSGNPQPSDDDLLLTEKIAQLADLLGLKLLDHLIIGHKQYFSIREHFSELLSV
jgi:DNA repair protein RadC